MTEHRATTTLLFVIAVSLVLIVLKLYSSDLVSTAYAQPAAKGTDTAQEVRLMGYSEKGWVRVRVDSEGRLLSAPAAQSTKQGDGTQDVRVMSQPLLVKIVDDQNPIGVNLVYQNELRRWESVNGEGGALYVYDSQRR